MSLLGAVISDELPSSASGKLEAAGWRVTFVNIFKTTHYHTLGLQDMNCQRCKHLKRVPYLFVLLKKETTRISVSCFGCTNSPSLCVKNCCLERSDVMYLGS